VWAWSNATASHGPFKTSTRCGLTAQTVVISSGIPRSYRVRDYLNIYLSTLPAILCVYASTNSDSPRLKFQQQQQQQQQQQLTQPCVSNSLTRCVCGNRFNRASGHILIPTWDICVSVYTVRLKPSADARYVCGNLAADSENAALPGKSK